VSFFTVFVIAFGLALVLTPLAGWVAKRYGLVAVPGPRRVHRGKVPRLGGVALYVAFTAAVIVAQFLPVPRQDPKELTRLLGVLLGSTFMFVVGLYDDRRELPPTPQLLAQLAVALMANGFLVFIERVNNPFTDQQVVFPLYFTVTFTVFWIMGMITTVNWLDGLDGLAAGVAAIASAVLAFHMYHEGQYSISLVPLALLGATLGFLPYNFHPARVFMGSCGALFLGYAMGTVSIVAGGRVAMILLALGLPILDVAWQIVNRLRRGRSVSQADLGHLHYRLLDIGLSQRQIVLLYYLFCAFFGGLALVISSRLYKFYAIVGFGLLAMAALWWLAHQGTESEESETGDTPGPPP
jgi:UDP-GlcNAc:undecaprenyl-phosphate GlcNAc-1-phosphate transferase